MVAFVLEITLSHRLHTQFQMAAPITSFIQRLETFKVKCEEIIRGHEATTTEYAVMPDGTKYVTLWGPHLQIKMGHKWAISIAMTMG